MLAKTHPEAVQEGLRNYAGTGVLFVKDDMPHVSFDQKGPGVKINPSYACTNFHNELKKLNLGENESVTFLLMTVYDDIAFYSNCIYMTKHGKELSCFISDSSRGVTGCYGVSANLAHEVSEFCNTHKLNGKIVMSCTPLQNDGYSCAAFAADAAKYFAEHTPEEAREIITEMHKGSPPYLARNDTSIEFAVLLRGYLLTAGLFKLCQHATAKGMKDATKTRFNKIKYGETYTDAAVDKDADISVRIQESLGKLLTQKSLYSEIGSNLVSDGDNNMPLLTFIKNHTSPKGYNLASTVALIKLVKYIEENITSL